MARSSVPSATGDPTSRRWRCKSPLPMHIIRIVCLHRSRRLSAQRLVGIVVGRDDEKQTFWIQEAVLVSQSWVLSRKLRSSTDWYVCLAYPDDGVEAWEVLAFWMVTHSLPECDFKDLKCADSVTFQWMLMRYWILGERYMIEEFQDDIMLELLQVLKKYPIAVHAAEGAIRGSAPGLKLRLLAAKAIIFAVHWWRKAKVGDFAACEGVEDYTSDLVTPMQRYNQKFSRLPKGIKASKNWHLVAKDTGAWKEYLFNPGQTMLCVQESGSLRSLTL